jgi:hypothetical protein
VNVFVIYQMRANCAVVKWAAEWLLTSQYFFRGFTICPARCLSLIFTVGHSSHARLARTSTGGFLDVDKLLDFATRTAQSSRSRCASHLRIYSFGRRLWGGCFAPASSTHASAVSHYVCWMRLI